MNRSFLHPVVSGFRSLMGTNRLADAVISLQDSVAAIQARADQPRGPPTPEVVTVERQIDINQLLHDSRSVYIREMPKGANCLLSAGCAGNWYFDWISNKYGDVKLHLGIEYYVPKPDDLLGNVTWITNTVMDMSAVDDKTCDLLFSGQNLEHLWPEEVAGFYLKSARVLKEGGTLVVDSPNREITSRLRWSHPQHTIELIASEACELARLSGFDVTAVRGIWLCRDDRTNVILPFDPNRADPGWSLAERLMLARDRPEDSFIWWVEARRNDRVPDRQAVHALMASLFEKHWPERTQRMLIIDGHQISSDAEGEWAKSEAGQGGVVLFGPYMPLRAGRYRVSWDLRSAPSSSLVAWCDVVVSDASTVLAKREVLGGENRVSLEFSVPEMTFGFEFRCSSLAASGFEVRRGITIETLD